MKKLLPIAAVVALALASCAPSYAGSGPNCTIGKPCGNSCISQKDTCHK